MKFIDVLIVVCDCESRIEYLRCSVFFFVRFILCLLLIGIFSDPNNIFIWIRRYKQKKPISKISVDSNFMLQVMHDDVVFHCSIDHCVELSLVDETLCENCSHFTLKWFQLDSFQECFFKENYKKMQKFQILKNGLRPLYEITEYAFNWKLYLVSWIRYCNKCPRACRLLEKWMFSKVGVYDRWI